MFCNTPLKSFAGDLSSLTDGRYMFYDCSELTSFTSELPSLTKGGDMFRGCKLDAESLEYIADSINDVSSLTISGADAKVICIGYNCSAALADAAYDTITGKGWSCEMTYNA